MKEEIFDVVDEFDRVIGSAPRSEVHRVWHKHRAVHIFAFDNRDRLWLQKRSALKDCEPLKWDSSAAGHLARGESYEVCAIREVREEMGIDVVPSYRFKLAAGPDTGWEHVGIYTCPVRGQIRFPREEIETGAYHSVASVARWLERDPDAFAPAFVRIFREFQRRGFPRKGT